MPRAIASWSGGKDSCFACYRALAAGVEMAWLLNFVSQEFKRVTFHGTHFKLIARQSQAVGIPIVQCMVTADLADYERKFKSEVSNLKQSRAKSIVFGDIDLQEHRDWIDRVCDELGVKPILPLWSVPQEQVLVDFIEQGFEAVVVCAKADLFGQEWLGRKIDLDFVTDLCKLKRRVDFHICGEQGEYHTLVINGPLFKKRLEVTYGERLNRDGYWFLDIPRYRIRPK